MKLKEIIFCFLILILTACDNFYKHLVMTDYASEEKKSVIYSDGARIIKLSAVYSKDRYSLESKQDAVNIKVSPNFKMIFVNESVMPSVKLIYDDLNYLDLIVTSNYKKELNYFAIIPEGIKVNHENIRILIQMPNIIIERDTIALKNVTFHYAKNK